MYYCSINEFVKEVYESILYIPIAVLNDSRKIKKELNTKEWCVYVYKIDVQLVFINTFTAIRLSVSFHFKHIKNM
jgi:hypothetical protein